MRKMFTKLFSLALLMYLVSSFSVARAQCDLSLSAGDIVLLTDLSTVCDSDLIQFAVTGFPDSTYYNFNSVGGDTTAAGFTLDSTFFVKEGVGFTVQVRYNDTCYSNILTYPGIDLIQPVYIDTLLLTHPLCFDDEGELTVVVGGTESFKVNFVDSTTWYNNGKEGGTYPLYNGSQFQAEPGKEYFVRVQSANGCTSLAWDSIKVNTAPAQLVIADVLVNGMRTDTIACVGDTAVVTVSGIAGGTAPYYVTLSDGQMDTLAAAGNALFNVTMPGSYTATVVDTFGCEIVSDSTAVLVGPEPITFDISLDDVTCADSATGAIYIHDIAGGINGSTYVGKLVGADTTITWTAAVNDTITFDSLAVGYYSVWVRDAACTLDSTAYVNPNNTQNTISLQAPGEIELDVAIDTVICYGDSSVITATATGGTESYEFSKDGGSNWGTTNVWKVPAGTYNVVVRDAGTSSCDIAWTPITLTDPMQVSIDTVVAISPTCPGGNDGVINITASAEPGRVLEYSLDSIAWYANNIFAVPAGEYTVYVRDQICPDSVATAAALVDTLDENILVIYDKDTFITCNGADDAWVDIDVDSWADQTGSDNRDIWIVMTDNPAQIYVSGDSTLDAVSGGLFTDLAPGTYYFWAADNFGCQSKNSITVVVTEADALGVTGMVTDTASCYGENDGIITLKMTGGTKPFKYGHANTLQAVTNLAAGAFTNWPSGADSVNIQVGMGTYYVVVKDSCGNSVYDGPFVVPGRDPVTIAQDPVDTTNIVCYGDSTGVIEVATAMGGSEAGYHYTLQKWSGSAWDDVTGYVDVTETMFDGLKAGTYKVVVTDDGGCDGAETRSIMIDGPDDPVVISSFSYTDITCYGAHDGKIMITANGGTGLAYQFKVGTTNWRNFPTDSINKTIVVTEPGMHIVWVRDSVGCVSAPDTAWIAEPEEIMLTVDTTDNTNTCDAPNGELEILVTGGRPGVQYIVQVNDSIYPVAVDSNVAITYTGLGLGDYLVTATEIYPNGCDAMVIKHVGAPDTINYTAVVMDSIHCRGGDDGIIVVSNIGGGSAPYVTTISGPVAGTKDSTATAITFSDLIAGVYQVTVTDALGCTNVMPLTISQPDTILLHATWIADITCQDSGKFSIQASGGSGQFIYFAAVSKLPLGHILVPDPLTSDAWQTDSIFATDSAGTYIVWAYDTINGCLVGGEEDVNLIPRNEWRVKIEPASTLVEFDATATEDVMCYGDSTGVIKVDNITVDGVASANVTITINGEMASDSIIWLAAGKYEIEVQDNVTGCSSIDSVLVDGPDSPLDVVLDKGDGEFTCPDVVEGYIEATATGGVGNYTYTLWQDGDSLNTYVDNSFLVQIGHEYVIVVNDDNGCMATDTLMLDPVAAVQIVDIMDVTCSSDTLGSILVDVTGEPGRMFQVQWTQFEADSPADQDTSVWFEAGSIRLDQRFMFDNENVNDIHYEFIVIDDMGCMSEKDTITIDQVITTPLVATVTVGDVVDCANEVMVSATGGVGPYMVVVDDMDTTSFEASTSIMIGGGTHMVDVYDAHECIIPDTISLDYINSMDTTFNIYVGDTAHLVYEPAMLDTMLVGGMYSFYYNIDTACVAEYNVTVNEREKMAPVLDTVSPMDTIADNHPLLTITFEDTVTLGDMGYLTVTALDSTTPALMLEITSDMIDGNTVTVTYDAAVSGGLGKNTTYIVQVDSGVIMGDGLAWGGIQDSSWQFTTGPEFATGINPEINATSFKVYPNPFNDKIYIDNYDKLTRVVITNIVGQRVIDVKYPEREIRTAKLVSGIYFVNMFIDNGLAKTVKIVKR